ncbi:unnamed protein product, partial [Hydatigera taeniaeformis]|uniref:Fibronectin type-III domain-containing protein n=1 Tax=Hydatigena taeniaeformis TaxID=6205 RepID=A0A0R3WXS4_HYDTA
MKKPKFEAKYYEHREELDLLIHDPEDVKGKFGGFEVLLRIGSPVLRNEWNSEANLTASERKYKVGTLLPSVPYELTVRGLVLPNVFSELADPLLFKPSKADQCAPQNVKLEAIDPHTVNMKWDLPAKSHGHIVGYTILWNLNNRKQKSIHLSSGQSYIFTNLQPKVSLSASVCAHYKPEVPPNLEYIGSFSKPSTVITPPSVQ